MSQATHSAYDPGTLTLAEAKLVLYGDASDPGREGLPTWGAETEDQKRAKVAHIERERRRMANLYVIAPTVLKNALGGALLYRVIRRVLERVTGASAGVLAKLAMVLVFGYRFGPAKRQSPPQFKSPVPELPILGGLIPFTMNLARIHNFLLEVCRKNDFRPFDIMFPTGMQFVLCTSLLDREFVLRTKPSLFLKNRDGDLSDFSNIFGEVLGRGIFGVDGDEWRDQRKIAAHMFSGQNLASTMERVFNAHGAKLAEMMDELADTGKVVDMQEVFQATIFDAFCEIAFDVNFDTLDASLKHGKRHEFLVSFDAAQNITARRIGKLPVQWHLERILGHWTGLGEEGELLTHLAVLKKYIAPVLDARLAEPLEVAIERKDLLGLYIEHARKTNQPHLVQGAGGFDLIVDFMVAGRDTTSCLLSNIVRHMNSRVQDRLARDLLPHVDHLGFAAQKEMAYPNAVVNEALRMNPSVGDDFHIATETVKLPSGIVCLEGARVFVPNLAIGRDPALWSEPDTFKPERWMRKDEATGADLPVRRVDEFVHPVFWAANRLCLGWSTARFEAVVMMSKLLTRFNFELVDGDKFSDEFVTGPVIFYQNGVNCRVVRRR